MIFPAGIRAALLLAALGDGPDPIRSIDDGYQVAVRLLYEARPEAEERAASAEFQAARAALVDRALGLAREHRGEPLAVDAWTWIVRNGRGNSEPRLQALEALGREYPTSDRLAEVCRWAPNSMGRESLAAERLLHAAIERNPNPEVRSRATFGLAELLEGRADLVRDVAQLPPAFRDAIGAATLRDLTARSVDDLTGEAETLYRRVAQDHPTLPHGRTGVALGAVAEGRAYRLRNLAVGRPAPEIEGVDIDGKPLKLSDHRGEVVVLTFSGTWCPSCHTLYPQQRDLLKRHQGRPFAVLSVDTDEDKAPLRRAIAAGEITWPCWWDGSVGGPITVRCGIYYFPTVFVLDRQGVVRFKDVQGPQLDEAVEALLNEPREPSPPTTP